jgi:ketosteroid isomerase-like protein
MSHPNADLLQRFYTAFAARDGATMAAAYTPDATFSDPAFVDLKDGEPGAMWRMLTGRAQDLEVQLLEHDADDERGTAHWVADYTFGGSGRHVHNDVHSTFRFRDGLIAEHHDAFDLWAWSRQALGTPGVLLGWSPVLKRKVRAEARSGLDQFLAAERSGASARAG